MKGNPLTLVFVSLVGILIGGTVTRADMPAKNFYWAKVDTIVKATDGFSAAEAAAFRTQAEKAVVKGGQPKAGLDPSYRNVEEYPFFGAFETLIKPHVEKGEIEKVDGFLKAVSDGKWIQGRLVARNGGDFVTILSLVAGNDGKYALRKFNKAVNPGDWKGTTFDHSLGIEVKKNNVGIPPRPGETGAKPTSTSTTAKPSMSSPAKNPAAEQPGAGPASQATYRAPDDVELELAPKGEPAASSGVIVLAGKVRVLIGQPTEMTIRFLCSDDLSVEPADVVVPTLAAGSERVFEVKVRRGKAAAEGRPWVKMLLKYSPDATAISAAVNADLKAYPNLLLRERLLKVITERKDPASRVVGYLFLNPPFPGKL